MALRTCITNYSFNRSFQADKLDTEGYLEWCGKAGFEGVDIMSYYWKDKEAELAKVPEWVERNGLKLIGFGTRSNFLTDDESVIAESQENIRAAIIDANRLGLKMCRVFGGSSFEGYTAQSATEQLVKCLGDLVKLAEDNDVILTVENHGGFPATADEVIGCIKAFDSPSFASLLDTGNFLGAGADPLEETKKLVPYVKHVHVKDMKKYPLGSEEGRKPQRADYQMASCLVGDGVVQNAEIFKVLVDGGYDGYVSLEAEGPHDMEDEERALKGLENMKKWIAEL